MNFDYETEEDIAMKSSEVARKKANVPIFLIAAVAATIFLIVIAKILSHVNTFDINKASIRINAAGCSNEALEISDYTAEIKDGMVVINAKIRNRGTETILYGKDYKLLRKGSLKLLNGKEMFESVGILLEKGKADPIVVNSSYVKEAGAYRIEKNFYFYDTPVLDQEPQTMWIEFEVY